MTTTDWRRLEKAERQLGLESEEPLVIQIMWVPAEDGRPSGPPVEGPRIVIGGAAGVLREAAG
jgi:hypothetical protein